MSNCFAYIQQQLAQSANPQKAQWLQGYVKHNIKSRGVGIPTIRQIVTNAYTQHGIASWSIATQAQLLNQLMEQQYTDDKLAAIIFLQLYWKQKEEALTLDLISRWFNQEFITDWNVCDWLCVRVLTPLLNHAPSIVIPELQQWNGARNQWKARASLVPFAQSKAITQHQSVIADFASVLIQRPERFCKTAVGWVLREYSKSQPHFVTTFLAQYAPHTTVEVVRNATKYLSRKT